MREYGRFMVTSDKATTQTRSPARLPDYLAMMRPSHWVKHVFIVPGIVLAFILLPRPLSEVVKSIILGFLSAALCASANYVLNEWLDAKSDAHHQSKSSRPAVTRELSAFWVWMEYVGCVVAGLGLALVVSKLFFLTSCVFIVSGLVYNVPPIRTKDVGYLDVLSESLNNPIRLTLGWVMVAPTTLPPGSLLLAYWMGGAFLMALKRLAEYRSARDHDQLGNLGQYRKSFNTYSEESLMLSSFLYALLAAFFLAVFLVKYRIEYLLSIPLFAALFVSYFRIALKRESPAQAPEGLLREKSLVFLVILLALTLTILTWVDIPILEDLTSPHYIEIQS